MSIVEEFRGVWVATTYNIDWPSKSGLSIEDQKQEFRNYINELVAIGMNSVVLQVRPMGDAFYLSNYAPWSKYITGTLGNNPGYDPLGFALDYCHQKYMKLHAWFNPFRISTDASFDKANYINNLPSGSLLKSNPEWIVNYSGSYWLNLAKPEVRSYVVETILEVAIKYDIDGVHLDDYFYPYPKNNEEFPDNTEFELYGSGYSSKADWRRDNVNNFISELSLEMRKVRADIKLGVSPFGIWRNGSSNGGTDTKGLSSYDQLYCDSLKWVKEERIDYITPQIYWSIGYELAAYEKLVEWWGNSVKGKNVSLYIGHATYKVGKGSTYGIAWDNPEEIPNQILLNRTNASVNGSCFFSVKEILANPLGLKDRLTNDFYGQWSINGYSIKERFISWNRSGKTLVAKGTVVHETATPGASDEAEFNYFNSGDRGASAHAFVDYDSITQTIPWNEQAWHARSTANKNYIGIELCNYNDASKFNEIWKRAVWLFAYVHVNIINVTTINQETLMSHAEVSNKWHESTHQDPIAYFAKYGKKVDDFRNEVQIMINKIMGMQTQVPQESSPQAPVSQAQESQTQSNSDQKVLQLQQTLNRLNITDNNGNRLKEDGIKGVNTTAAVKKLQQICGLVVDGIAGVRTFGALDEILAKPLLKTNSRGIPVRYVQFRLGITYDGIFGPATRNVIISLQGKMGLAKDGIVGPNTWRALIG